MYPAFLDSIKENDGILVEKYGQEYIWNRTDLFFPFAECQLAEDRNWPVMDAVLSLADLLY